MAGAHALDVLGWRVPHGAMRAHGLTLTAIPLQVQTLVELRAIDMERRGKMSRYGPLLLLELLKCVPRFGRGRGRRAQM